MEDNKTNLKFSEPTVVENQKCPMCLRNSLKITEYSTEVPFFGTTYLFTAECTNQECNFKISDVEFENTQQPVRISFDIENEQDLNVLVVKSSNATAKIGNLAKIEEGSDGYITTIEGLLERVKKDLELAKESAEEDEDKAELWETIKKINRILWGENKVKIIIEDPTGNSAIISEKAKKEVLKKK